MALPAHDDAGVTLLELMVAVAISGIVITLVGSLIVQSGTMQRQMAAEMEKEDLRSILRQRLRCDRPCSQTAAELPKQFGKWSLTYDCSSITQGIRPAMVKTSTGPQAAPVAPVAVFGISDGYPCQGRLPANCLTACHWSGELGNRGYLSPPLAPKTNNLFLSDGRATSNDLTPRAPAPACVPVDWFGARAQVVGVDFGTGRVLCADDRMFGPPGPYCKIIYASNLRDFTVTLGGRVPCTEYTQVQAEAVMLGGTLKVVLANGFVPGNGDRFVVVVGNHLSGSFDNAHGTVATATGGFLVSYEQHAVVLSGFTPAKRLLEPRLLEPRP